MRSNRSRTSRRVRSLEERVESLRTDLEAVERELENLRLDPAEDEPQTTPRLQIGSRVRILVGRGAYGDQYEEGVVTGFTRRRVKVLVGSLTKYRAPSNVRLIQDG